MLSRDAGLFGLLKMVGVVTYDSLSPEEQKSISGLVVANSPDLAKILMLGALPNLPKRYIDGLYFRSILQGASVILLPAVSVLLAAASDATQLFYDLIDFGLQRLTFKSLFISLVTKELFVNRASSGSAELKTSNYMDKSVILNWPMPCLVLCRAFRSMPPHAKQSSPKCTDDSANTTNAIYSNARLRSSYNYVELIRRVDCANTYTATWIMRAILSPIFLPAMFFLPPSLSISVV